MYRIQHLCAIKNVCLEVSLFTKFFENISSHEIGQRLGVVLSQTGDWEGGRCKRQHH